MFSSRTDQKGVAMDLASTGGPQVELGLPADNAYAAVLRMTAAGLAARAEFTVDAIEDLKISVGEAITLLIPLAAQGSRLHTAFTVWGNRIHVDMATTTEAGAGVDESSFAWQVLTTLTENCGTVASSNLVRVEFAISSEAAET